MRLVTAPFSKTPTFLFLNQVKRRGSVMAGTLNGAAAKKVVKIDISSDPVCPWCFVGKRNLDKAIAATKDRFDFEIRWHPFFLNPSAPKEGVDKVQYYKESFGPYQAERVFARMAKVFKDVGVDYKLGGLTGNTMESHRLLYFASQQSPEKQHQLAEELFVGYFTQAKFVGDRSFLLECAQKVGVEGATEFLADPNNGVKEVYEELEKYSAHISGVPYFVIGRNKISGAQPPEVFLRAFEVYGH